MKLPLILGAAAITTVALFSSKALVQGTEAQGLEAPATIPETPAVELPLELVFAQPFQLATPEVHEWRAERPSFTEGLVLVLEGDADFFEPRQSAEPVLYVGDQTAQRLNAGYPSGQLVVLVPGLALEDLADAPIFFGQPELPERIDAATAAAELAGAQALGVTGPGQVRVDQVVEPAPIEALDLEDLFFQTSFLIELYSPSETDLIEGRRVKRIEFK